jgi:hypothetical protein
MKYFQPASMVHGPPPGMKGVSNGHRSPVFGTPGGHRSPVFGTPGPIGTPVRVAALPGTPVNTTPHQYRNRQSPGICYF